MTNVADTYHLQRRGTKWYYHRRVPSELAPIVGKSVIKHSPGTSSKTEAKRLRAVHDVETDAMFANLRKPERPAYRIIRHGAEEPSSSPRRRVSLEVLTEYLREAVASEDAASRERLLLDPPSDEEQLDELRGDAEIELQMLVDPADDRRSQGVSTLANKVLSDAEAEPSSTLEAAKFRELVRRALIELSQRRLSRYEDRYDLDWFDALFDPHRPKSLTIRKLADDYLKEKEEEYGLNGVSTKRRDKVESHVRTLVDIVGPDTLVDYVDDEAVQRVRSTLARLPANRSKLYPGFSIDEAVTRAAQQKKPVLSATTQQRYLDDLRGLLSLAVRRKLLTNNRRRT